MAAQVQEDNSKANITNWLKMVERLRHSTDWSEDERPIELIQTHISVVLLSRRHALKLKKPVDFGFLDYTTLEKRLAACEAEIDLNRRLCADTYLGVQPIIEANGEPHLRGEGRIIDYGVLMKRLPAAGMLDQMLRDNAVTESLIDGIAAKLAGFHKSARRGVEVDSYGSVETIRQNWEENFAQTAPFINRTITQKAFDSIRFWVTDWLEQNSGLLQRRVADGRICDGHGDLRSESICVINSGICFFDCIEFNERFRCGDTASEAAFLAMDLDAHERPDLGYYFCERYETFSDDDHLYRILPFYRCYRAFVRGKVLSFRLEESGFSETELDTARMQAENYFALAARYTTRLRQPTVIAVTGLSGTGKTSVARAVAAELGLRVISADAVRKSIFGDTQNCAYGEGAYSDEGNRLTYQKLLEQGLALLPEESVVLDATFRRADDRAQARSLIESVGAKWRLIECRLAPELIHRRLEQRTTRKEGLSDATWETYLTQREEFESINRSTDEKHLILDTSFSLRDTSRRATDWLRENDEL